MNGDPKCPKCGSIRFDDFGECEDCESTDPVNDREPIAAGDYRYYYPKDLPSHLDAAAPLVPQGQDEKLPQRGPGNPLLCNATKIQFCNAMAAMKHHCKGCDKCDTYIVQGDGDLCYKGKDIITMELAYAETNPLRKDPL